MIINSIVQALFMPSAEELTEMVRTGGLDVVLIVWDGGKAHLMAGFLKGDGKSDDRVNVTGGAVRSENDAPGGALKGNRFWCERGFVTFV